MYMCNNKNQRKIEKLIGHEVGRLWEVESWICKEQKEDLKILKGLIKTLC